MAVSASTPADIVNLALRRIGYKKAVGSLYDGSAAAQVALDIYGQTRDEMLRGFDWGFAKREVALTLLKQAPDGGYFPPVMWSNVYPPLPYRFEYAYPDDCLKVRCVQAQPLFLFNPDPSYEAFEIGNDAPADTPTIFQKVILCDVQYAVCTYTGRVVDPSSWEADFVESFAAALGQRLAPALVGLEQAKMEAQDAIITKGLAQQVQG